MQVAENNLGPLRAKVREQRAAYTAEDAQYQSWHRKMGVDEQELEAVEAGKAQISKRLAQLKVLGRRAADDMPQLRMKIISAEHRQAVDVQAARKFGKLSEAAGEQMTQTQRAENDDTSAVSQEQAFVRAQQGSAKTEMEQADAIMDKTSAVERRIAALEPEVGRLRAAWTQDERHQIQAGMVKLDEERQRARDTLNRYIRRRVAARTLGVSSRALERACLLACTYARDALKAYMQAYIGVGVGVYAGVYRRGCRRICRRRHAAPTCMHIHRSVDVHIHI